MIWKWIIIGYSLIALYLIIIRLIDRSDFLGSGCKLADSWLVEMGYCIFWIICLIIGVIIGIIWAIECNRIDQEEAKQQTVCS